MDKIWYVFKVDSYTILNGKFKEMETAFFIYNSRTKWSYKDSNSLVEALNNGRRRYILSVFFDPILKGQVPLFASDKNTTYYDSPEAVYNALPKIQIGETFADKVATYNFFYGYNDFSLTEFLALVKKFKRYLSDNDSSIALTKREIERLEKGRDKFVSITLLSTSKLKPTVDDLKKDYPELLM